MTRFTLGVTDGIAFGIGVALVAIALGYVLTRHDQAPPAFPLGRGPITTPPTAGPAAAAAPDDAGIKLPGTPSGEGVGAQSLKNAARGV